MIYYVILAFIDLCMFVFDRWKELTFTMLASGAGVILGKRIGTKLAVNYIMKTLGMQQKPMSELQMEHHENEIIKLGGQPWIAPTSKPYRINIRRILFKRSMWSRMVRSIARFTKRYINLRRKKSMSKFKSRKFILAVVGAILIILNEGLDMGISSETVLAFAGLIAVWISGESYVDGKRAEVTDAISTTNTESNK